MLIRLWFARGVLVSTTNWQNKGGLAGHNSFLIYPQAASGGDLITAQCFSNSLELGMSEKTVSVPKFELDTESVLGVSGLGLQSEQYISRRVPEEKRTS